jgi:hypothetical protein
VHGDGGSQLYRGWLGSPATEASGNAWLLRETVVRMDPATTRTATLAFARLLRAGGTFVSPRFGAMSFVWSDDTGFLVTRTPSAGSPGALGISSAWTLRQNVLIQLDTLPGGAQGGRSLTGSDEQWLIGLLDVAAGRAGAPAP